VVEVLVNIWDDPKFSKPTNAVGDWKVVREAYFEHDDGPTAVRFMIEKLTVQLLRREPVDIAAPALRYSGTSGAGGHPSTVRLELKAAGPGRNLYLLISERTAPKRWEEERKFTDDCDRRFAYWCAKLDIVSTQVAAARLARVSRASLELAIFSAVAAEDAAARVVEDPVPIAEVQAEVLAAMRAGMGFFTAGKEGGSHLKFDGKVYRRIDYGEEPFFNESHADGAGMLVCLRKFFDWESRRHTYPHPKPELEVWEYIRGRLRPM
jgi:hypothetical protein